MLDLVEQADDAERADGGNSPSVVWWDAVVLKFHLLIKLVLTLLFTCVVAAGTGAAWARDTTTIRASYGYDADLNAGTTQDASAGFASQAANSPVDTQQTTVRLADKLCAKSAECAPPRACRLGSIEARGAPVPRGGAGFAPEAATARPFAQVGPKGKVHNPGLFEVGPYNELKTGPAAKLNELVPHELRVDVHHAGQKALMRKLVPGYTDATGPSIIVPALGHTERGVRGIVSRSTKGIRTVEELVSRDIDELSRVYPGIPDEAIARLRAANGVK